MRQQPLTALNKQIALKKAEAELLALNSPTDDPDAEKNEATKRLNAEIAYLTAQKTLIEAQRAPAAAGGT